MGVSQTVVPQNVLLSLRGFCSSTNQKGVTHFERACSWFPGQVCLLVQLVFPEGWIGLHPTKVETWGTRGTFSPQRVEGEPESRGRGEMLVASPMKCVIRAGQASNRAISSTRRGRPLTGEWFLSKCWVSGEALMLF